MLVLIVLIFYNRCTFNVDCSIGINLIEWPDRLIIYPNSYMNVEFKILNDQSRLITLSSVGEKMSVAYKNLSGLKSFTKFLQETKDFS